MATNKGPKDKNSKFDQCSSKDLAMSKDMPIMVLTKLMVLTTMQSKASCMLHDYAPLYTTIKFHTIPLIPFFPSFYQNSSNPAHNTEEEANKKYT